MKNYKYILFDVDGTLIDSEEGIINAFNYALKSYDIETSREILRTFIGPPLKDTFTNYYNFDEENANLLVKKYREYYSKIGVKENSLYNGIEQLLKDLKKENKFLIIATGKLTAFTEEILKMHNIKKYFDFVSGATFNGSRSQKEDIIKYAIDKMRISNLNECVMIGDKKYDVIGAKINNIDSIGVTYGFGTKEELRTSNATYIVDTIKDIEKILK